jgi:hypothetical protein
LAIIDRNVKNLLVTEQRSSVAYESLDDGRKLSDNTLLSTIESIKKEQDPRIFNMLFGNASPKSSPTPAAKNPKKAFSLADAFPDSASASNTKQENGTSHPPVTEAAESPKTSQPVVTQPVVEASPKKTVVEEQRATPQPVQEKPQQKKDAKPKKEVAKPAPAASTSASCEANENPSWFNYYLGVNGLLNQ